MCRLLHMIFIFQVIPALAHVIKSLLVAKASEMNVGRRPSPEAYIACTNRNPQSIALFLEELARQQLDTEVVFKRAFSPSDCTIVSHEPLQPVTLYRIQMS